ncbi:AEC family transporter [Curvivirga sp.]|uniref:AEC family transporter n=1 Tax=Curvivirga sp. TaxID=2856848 RepID=UPI003B5A6BD6
MYAILNVALPVFAIMGAGFLCGRFRFLGQDSTAALNGFVYYAALPALFIVSMSRAPVDDILNIPYLAAYVGGTFATYGIALFVASFFFADRLGAMSQHGWSAAFANTGYMGIPLMITAFGEEGAVPAIVATIINGGVLTPLAIVILELDKSDGETKGQMMRRVFGAVVRNPLLIGAAIGLFFAFTGIALPLPVETFTELLGAAASPAALFAMGLFLVNSEIKSGLIESGWASFIKLIIHPAITWILVIMLDLPPLFAASAIIMAALPTGGLVFLVSQQFNTYVDRSASIILISTLVSIITLSALLSYLVPG